MKKAAIAFITLIALSGCTDATRASLFAYGDEAWVTCYSGGAVIFQQQSTGKVAQLDGDGITFKSKADGSYVRAFADCIVTTKRPAQQQGGA